MSTTPGWSPEYIAYLVDHDFDPDDMEIQFSADGGPFLFETGRPYVSDDVDLSEITEDAPVDLTALRGLRTTAVQAAAVQVSNAPAVEDDVVRLQDFGAGIVGDIVLNGSKLIFDEVGGDTYLKYNAARNRLELHHNGELFQSWP